MPISSKHIDPTPEEIAAACYEIQEEWSDDERARRAGLKYLTEAKVHVARCKTPRLLEYDY